MKFTLTKAVQAALISSTLLTLTACSNSSYFHSESSAKVAARVVDNELAQRLAQLEQQAAHSSTFEYIYNQEKYITYLANTPVLIKGYVGHEESKFFYSNGKLLAVQDQTGLYEFSSGKLVRAVDLNGRLVEIDTLAEKEKSLLDYATRLAQRFSYNRADKNVGRVTGAEAKLNYLCIDKIKQTAQTNRVFRSSANRSNSSERLTADLRLNGDQYYNMDCQLSGDRVSKLSLIQK